MTGSWSTSGSSHYHVFWSGLSGYVYLLFCFIPFGAPERQCFQMMQSLYAENCHAHLLIIIITNAK